MSDLIGELHSIANGMMPEMVYRRIYKVSRQIEPPHVVEVGTGHGAATVAMARGMLEGAKATPKVISFEKILGGSRERYGSVEENRRKIREVLRHFDVEEVCKVHIGDVAAIADRVPARLKLGGLVLDADGAIDRDFSLFYDQLVAGGHIIIDDCVPKVKIKRTGWRTAKIDLKHTLTASLLNTFVEYGLVSNVTTIGETCFARKTSDSPRYDDIPCRAVVEAYRSLTFGESSIPGWSRTLANRLRQLLVT